MIPFNKPYISGRELVYITDAVSSGKLSGDGKYTKLCHQYLEKKYGFQKVLLTTSCTDALEMAAILLNIASGDEVIMPAFTFVSTANAFALRGAKLVFADSGADHPNIEPDEIAKLITDKTKAIVVVHYAGVACDMDRIMALANANHIPVVEDAAQAIDSYYRGKPLGSFGAFGTFSFHETKNIIAGECGALIINDPKFNARAEIIREKGTNRSSFFRGEVDKYGWVDVGSSFLPAEIVAAHLYAQLEEVDIIQARRKTIWDLYYLKLQPAAMHGHVQLPSIGQYSTNNAHMFQINLPSLVHRDALVTELKAKGILAVFHYLSLHTSPYFNTLHDGRSLPNSDRYTDNLLRLPLFYELTDENVEEICQVINSFYLVSE